MRSIYRCKREIIEDKYKEKFGADKNIFLYDMHDGKMLYALTQHSAYNRKYHPFLLCKCGPGDGVRDPSHVCLLIEHDKQVERFERSKTKWTHFAKTYEQKVPPQKYTESDHRNWADTMNYGITHYGVHPSELRRDNIRFDVFHLRCAETRKLMTFLRKFVRCQSYDFQDKFHRLLHSFWNQYQLLIWRLNKSFTSFQGVELLGFIKNIPSIIELLKSSFTVNHINVHDICEGLRLWHKITPFLVITSISNTEEYLHSMDRFEDNLKYFYAVGAKTFFTKNTVGDEEIL